MKDFTIDEVCTMLNLAMKVSTGTVDLDKVFWIFREDIKSASQILTFWDDFDDMTKAALAVFSDYIKDRNNKISFLERCLEK